MEEGVKINLPLVESRICSYGQNPSLAQNCMVQLTSII